MKLRRYMNTLSPVVVFETCGSTAGWSCCCRSARIRGYPLSRRLFLGAASPCRAMGTAQAFVWKTSGEELRLELLQRSGRCSIESLRRGLFMFGELPKLASYQYLFEYFS